MKMVKGLVSLITGESVLAEIPSNWKTLKENVKFLDCVNIKGGKVSYNINGIKTITEMTEQLWNNALTRLSELEKVELPKKE